MSEAPKKRWYVIQVHSGYEAKVMRSLREHIKLHGKEEFFGEIMVPTEKLMETSGSKQRQIEDKLFPGYVLVEMVMNDESWHLVRRVPRIIGFIGGSAEHHPPPISDKEFQSVNARLNETVDRPRPKTRFEPGQVLRVSQGPFADFEGTVEVVDYEKSRLKVSVSIFGRATPVELDFNQVEKAG